jgi:tetratricopeptide (TPR) repeat protein
MAGFRQAFEVRQRVLVYLLAAVAVVSIADLRAWGSPTREAVTKIVVQIQRADYEGDRPALKRLNGELEPFVADPQLASRVRYWRGFALWRKALNGFNDNATTKELEEDLTQALGEFDEATAKDGGFVEAKIGAESCLGNLMFLNQNNPARVQELLARAVPLLKELRAEAPDNPRMLWVLGPVLWVNPPERGGGHDKALETYEKGLELARAHKGGTRDQLEPSWGEPELLMNLAWSNLNRTAPDLIVAERQARAALELVPYWHYVRDILLKQIEEAKAKAKSKSKSK